MNEHSFLRYLYQPAVSKLAHWIAPAGLSPIQISLIAFVISILSAWLFSSEFYAGLFFGGLLAYISICFHLVGEEIRRLKNLPAEEFKRIDKAFIFYSELILIAGLCAHTVIDNPRILCLIIGILAAAGILLLDKIKERPTGEIWNVLAFIENPALRIFMLCIGAVLNMPLLALLLIAACSNSVIIASMKALQK